MKHALLLLLAIGTLRSTAQVSIDAPIILTGAAADRHVAGLPDGAASDHALGAGTLQAGAYSYALATGSDVLSIFLTPALTVPIAGTNVLVKITAANTGAVTISVDGSGPYPVLKNGSLDLQAGDLQPGMVAGLVFDGTVFHLTNARRVERRACPTGFVQVNELYCIEPVSHDTLYLDAASVLCGNLDARVCTWGEWYFACTQAGMIGLQNMGNQWEWTNNTGNGPGGVRVVGATSCTHSSVGPAFDTVPRKLRCCYDR
ncbi:MAG: hypothetical protein WAU70_17265 [Flavobacteriales bacterium]